MRGMSTSSQQTKRVNAHLLWKELEALVLANTLIRFSKNRIKGLAPGSEVAGCVGWHGEGGHVDLGRGMRPGLFRTPRHWRFAKAWIKENLSFSLSGLSGKAKDLSLADRHPNRLCFQVAVFNNVHSGPETNEPDLLKLSIGLDACKWAEAFKMMSAPLNQTLSENPDVVRRLLRRRGRKSIKKAKLSSKFKNKHP